MLSDSMKQALNDQINHELYSAYLYLSMAAHFEAANLSGFANWMKYQAREEQEHAMKFLEYLLEQDAAVTLKAIQQPPAQFGSPQATMQAALEHEQHVTGLINQLYGLALQDKDYASQGMLQWFVNEQVEEEGTLRKIVEQLKMVGDHGAALFMVNAHLGSRAG
jgi:ferritin